LNFETKNEHLEQCALCNFLTPFGLLIHPSVSFCIGQQNLADFPFKMYSILAQDPEHPTCFPNPLAQG